MIRVVCHSHIGKRPNHEDNFWLNGRSLSTDQQVRMPTLQGICHEAAITERTAIFAVSDGMGGQSAGEVASGLCVRQIGEAAREISGCTSLSAVTALLQDRICRLNDQICTYSHKYRELSGMGATLVCLAVFGSSCAILNVGDSRAYLFHQGKLTQITKDHTEGQRMLDLGILSRKELAGFPARKHLNRYFGYDAKGYTLTADVFYPPISEKDVLLLCSDGLTDALDDVDIENILCMEKDICSTGATMIDRAIHSPDADNVTVLLIQFGE